MIAVLKKDGDSIKIHPTDEKSSRLLKNYFPGDLLSEDMCCSAPDGNSYPDVKNQSFPVCIVQWDNDSLMTPRCNMLQDYLKVEESKNSSQYEVLFPIIHILEDSDLLDFATQAVLPRHVKLMDSSIWNYCIWSEGKSWKYQEEKDKERVRRVVYNIWHNWEKCYYMTSSAIEYADLNARISQQSYIVGTQHGKDVIPFIFHSEYQTREYLKRRLSGGADAFCLGYQWRFLLLDDHASIAMNEFKNKTSKDCSVSLPTKLEIIMDRLQSIPGMKIAYKNAGSEQWEGEIEDFNIAIECVTNIDGLFDHLRKKRYDIILLDYLLGKQKDETRIYSYELFSRLKNEINQNDIGPDGRLYFMFISSFVHAIQERLEEQHISRNDKNWFIGRGSCPLNTPEIFLFNLHSIMLKRTKAIKNLDSIPALMKGLFQPSDKDGYNCFETQCRNRFVDLLNLTMALERLRKKDLNQEDGLDKFNSVLAASMLKKNKIPEQDFWEHLQHLCYMISFEPKSRWPEWWEEYLFIKDRLSEFSETSATSLKDFIVRASTENR